MLLLASYASTYFCITLPLKVWNSTRNEARLEEKERLLCRRGWKRWPARSIRIFCSTR